MAANPEMDGVTAPTLAELQAVPLAAWRAAIEPVRAWVDWDTGDWGAGCDAGLVEAYAVGPGDGIGDHQPPVSVRVTPTGDRYLAALWTVVDGLTERMRSALRGGYDSLTTNVRTAGALQRRRLWASGTADITDLGRAAVLLLERLEGRSAVLLLERLDD